RTSWRSISHRCSRSPAAGEEAFVMDYDPPIPVERVLARKRWIRWLVVLVLVLAALYWLIFVNQYVIAYRDPVDHFKYGSIGSETASALPALVSNALPAMYRDGLGP